MPDEKRSRSGTARIIEITDEREPAAETALQLIAETFPSHERQPLSELRSEIEEKRRALLDPFDFHLFGALEPGGGMVAAAAGVYLAGINAGFISYLAVDPSARRGGVAKRVRATLVAAFREDARRVHGEDLAWVLGEVRTDGHWLSSLIRNRGAIPLDLTYYHPGMVLEGGPPYALYREPVGDHRLELRAAEVRRVVYAVWRRGYRVRYPLERVTFQAMMEELDVRDSVGVHPDYLEPVARRGREPRPARET